MTLIMGVMPTPPAISTMLASSPMKVKTPRGADTSTASPTATLSCRCREMRPCSSRFTVTSTWLRCVGEEAMV